MYARSQVVQRFLDLYPNPHYLEVGVFDGETFLAVQARRKVAVDPKFAFEARSLTTAFQSIEYHELPSDEYFASVAKPVDMFDVIYLDGLHTFEQTLRDLLNASFFLRPNGVIILDDVIPSAYASSLPSIPEWNAVRIYLEANNPALPHDGCWMGDVYKVVFFIQTFMQQYTYATVQENHGQTVLWRQPRPVTSIKERSVEEVGRMQFKEVVTQRADFLSLPIDTIAAMVAGHFSLPAR